MIYDLTPLIIGANMHHEKGKTKKINYKLKKVVKNKPNDFIIVENTHEAIIDRDTFNYVQTFLPKNVKRPEKILPTRWTFILR